MNSKRLLPMTRLIIPLIVLLLTTMSLTQLIKVDHLSQSQVVSAKEESKDTKSNSKENENNSSTNQGKINDKRVSASPTQTFESPPTLVPIPTSTPITGSTPTINSTDKNAEDTNANSQKPLGVPHIKSPNDGEKVRGKLAIEVWAPGAYSVEFNLQTAAGPAKAFFLGVAQNDSGKFSYDWDSANTPNWVFTLIVKANYNFHQSLYAKNINLTVDNPIPELPNQKQERNQTLERLGLSLPSPSNPQPTTDRNTTSASPTPSISPSTSPSVTQTPKESTKNSSPPKTSSASARSVKTPEIPNATSSAQPASTALAQNSAENTQTENPSTPINSETAENAKLPERSNVEVVANSSSELGFNPTQVSVSDEVKIEKIENITKANKTSLELKGKATPFSIVTLYILSDPIVVTVKADANGNWEYNLDKPLVSGEHEVFITVAKADGSLVRSEVTNFAIAKAAGNNQEQGLVLVAESGNKFQVFITYTAGLIVLAVSILLVIFFLRKPQEITDVID